MSRRAYLLATERTDLVPGNLRGERTPGVPFSAGEPRVGFTCWRLASGRDGMFGRVFIFRARPGNARTDDATMQRVRSEPRYLRDESLPYYWTDTWDEPRGRWSGYGAHARADELFPLGPPVDGERPEPAA